MERSCSQQLQLVTELAPNLTRERACVCVHAWVVCEYVCVCVREREREIERERALQEKE